MDNSTIFAVLEKLDPESRFVELDMVLDSFGYGGQGPSFVGFPFVNAGAECDPLDVDAVFNVGSADAVRVGRTNIAKELIEAFSDDPEHYRQKAQAMAAALRALADQLEGITASPSE